MLINTFYCRDTQTGEVIENLFRVKHYNEVPECSLNYRTIKHIKLKYPMPETIIGMVLQDALLFVNQRNAREGTTTHIYYIKV